MQLRFTSPAFGILDWLAMPYYGFLACEDWSGDSWKDPQKITASGAYKLEHIAANTVTLSKRPSWFSHESTSPEQVTFVGIVAQEDLLTLPRPVIGLASDATKPPPDETLRYVHASPTGLQAIAFTSQPIPH